MLKVEDLHVSYGKIEALHGISFDIKEGEIFTILGSNGAGKSTTLKTIVGLMRANSGAVSYNGEDISKATADYLVRAGIRLVPEGRQIFPEHTVYENLLLGAHIMKNKAEVEAKVQEMYEMFPRLKERQKQQAGTMSGGERQMLAISRALMTSPKLLILDEPSLGLAPIIVQEIMENLKKLRSEGMTILLVEQMAAMALQISDRACVFEVGRVAITGTSEELRSSGEILKAYLGA